MRHALLLLIALPFLAACDSSSDEPPGPTTLVGERATFGDAEARSWVRSADGVPEAVGVTFGADALDHLLAEHDEGGGTGHGMFELALDLPDVSGLPFDHVTLDWNPQGHEPPGLFDLPHVDVHFYLFTSAERDAITPADPEWEEKLAAMPGEAAIPPGYVPTPGGVPRMGAHWIDTADPTYAPGSLFREVVIYGFYDGEMAFVEPMLTADFVRSREAVDETLAVPAVYPERGYYPTRYTARYDAEAGEYTVAIEGLTLHEE